jgi:hypothetical protein
MLLAISRDNVTQSPISSTMTEAGTRLVSIQSISKSTRIGIIDPVYNKGPLFWYRLDASIRTELEQQYTVVALPRYPSLWRQT